VAGTSYLFLKYARAVLDIGAQAASLLPYQRHTIRYETLFKRALQSWQKTA